MEALRDSRETATATGQGETRLEYHADHTRVLRERAEPGRVRGFLRDLTVAGASVLVVALLVGYALAGPTPELTAAVGPAVPQPGTNAVVQGRVLEPDGSALDGVRIDVLRAGRIAASAVTGDTGTFRLSVPGGCASYRVSLQATVMGSDVETAAERRLCPGDALPVDARVITQGHFLWVPGPR